MPDLLPNSAPPTTPTIHGEAARIRALWERNNGSMLRFIRVVLGEKRLWSKQEEVCDSIDRYHTTLIPAGNSVGKSFLLGRVVLASLLMHRNAIVFTNSPSQHQLVTVLWKEVRAALDAMPIPLGIDPRGSAPIMLQLAPNWFAIGHVSNKVERLTGHHARRLTVVIDEGSGVADPAYEALWSLKPWRIVVAGNPLHPHGRFHELNKIANAERAAELAGGPARTVNVVKIPSTASPYIDDEDNPYGMADKSFLAQSRRDYGEGSKWWKSHILAEFPDESAETCVPEAHLDLACMAVHKRGGPARLAIDCAGGNGGDDWVLLARDDNGILDLRWSNTWSPEAAATQAALICQQWGIPGFRVSFDYAGLGRDFGNRLAAVGLHNANPYLGNYAAVGYPNIRSHCAQLLRWRLDPGYLVPSPSGVLVPQVPFSFNPTRKDWHPRLREVGQFLRELHNEVYKLEDGKAIRERLRKSPDTADAFFQSWAFLN